MAVATTTTASAPWSERHGPRQAAAGGQEQEFRRVRERALSLTAVIRDYFASLAQVMGDACGPEH